MSEADGNLRAVARGYGRRRPAEGYYPEVIFFCGDLVACLAGLVSRHRIRHPD